MSPEDKIQAKNLYLRGNSVAEVSRQMNRTYETIARLRDAENWDEQRKELMVEVESRGAASNIEWMKATLDEYDGITKRIISELPMTLPKTLEGLVSSLVQLKRSEESIRGTEKQSQPLQIIFNIERPPVEELLRTGAPDTLPALEPSEKTS